MQKHSKIAGTPHQPLGLKPFVALSAVVSIGVIIFYSLYSLIPVAQAQNPEKGSLFLGIMMTFVMGVQVFAPTLVRRYSLRIVLGGSTALMGVGALIIGTSSRTPFLLVGAIAVGLGFGVMAVAGAKGVALLASESQLGRALGVYGGVTTTATAFGSPAGMQLALSMSPTAYGITAFFAGLLALGVSFGIPAALGRVQHTRSSMKRAGSVKGKTQTMLSFLKKALAGAPWLVLGFLLVGIVLMSHGLTSLPVLAASYMNAALVVFSVQAANAVGRGIGGELEARTSTSITLVIGAALLVSGGLLGVLLDKPITAICAGVLLGLGIGIVQTSTLHTSMRLMSAGGASVIWNLAFDTGLWIGGILWGLALTQGQVSNAIFLFCGLILIIVAVLVRRLRLRSA